jgi:Zn-dependent protease/CBS domain-containing protein
MSMSFSIGRWLGIPIKLHISWLVIFALVWFSLGAGFVPNNFPNWNGPQTWAAAFITAILFFASVLGHELAHATVARMRGVPVRGITLFALGGAAELERDAEQPVDEVVITAVGPLSSLAFAALFWVIELVTQGTLPVVSGIADFLAVINVSLALFNLIPGFPLDGGRILRALLWWGLHDFMRATRIAVRVGQGVAWLFILWGLAQTLLFREGLGGLWIVFIGWFLNNAADQTLQQVRIQELLRGVRASQLMRSDFARVLAGTAVQDLVYQYFLPTGRPDIPVFDGEQFVGLVSLHDIKELEQARWSATPVREVMVPVAKLPAVDANSSAEQVLRLFQDQDTNQVPVLDDGRLVGIITQADILRFLRTREEVGRRGPLPQPTGTPPPAR